MTQKRKWCGGVEGDTYGYFCSGQYRSGGFGGSDIATNIIDYINVTTTTGDATDRGDLANTPYSPGGA